MKPRTLLPLFLLLLLPATGWPQEFPRSPDNPTTADCDALSTAYYDLLRAKGSEISQCMKGEPRIGYAMECGRRTLRAWTQCAPLDTERCAIDENRKQQEAICRARAKKLRDAKDRAGEALRAEQSMERKRAEELKKVNSYYETAQNIADAITDPVSFIQNELGEKIREKIFPSTGPAQEDAAQELYNHVFSHANEGLGSTAHPVIREIQRTQLENIRQHGQMMLEQFKNAQENFNQSLAEVNTGAPSPRPLPLPLPIQPLPAGGGGPTTRATPEDCAVLKSMATSSALLNRDRRRWMELNQLCE